MRLWGSYLFVGLMVARFASPADASSYNDAYLSHVEGELSLQRAAEPAPEPGTVNLPVLAGDRIWTHPGARAEVRLPGDAVLRLSENTKVDFVDFGAETIVRVWSGSVILEVVTTRANLRIDSPAGSVHGTESGMYRLDVRGGESSTLTVTRGTAELQSSAGSVLVRSGETSTVDVNEPPDAPRPFNTASFDDFDSWSDSRSRRAATVREVEVRNVPYEVQSYAQDLSEHGDWAVDSSYGYVWYPSVSVSWAPYRQGRFCYTRYGYTWVSYEPWGWAPYHYGRWGHGHRGWYWIPGSTWGPAWVSFAVGPFWVGWSPLGYHNRPVYVFDDYIHPHRRGHRRPGPHDRDGGWNFATRDEFGRRTAHARLDPALVRASASTVAVYDEGAPLDRDLKPRENRRGRGLSDGFERGAPERAIVSRSAAARPAYSTTTSENRTNRAEVARPRAIERIGTTEAPRVTRSGPTQRNRDPVPARSGSSREIVSSPYVERPREEPRERSQRVIERPTRTERERPSVTVPRSEPQRTRVERRPVERTQRVEREPPSVTAPRSEPQRTGVERRPVERTQRVERDRPSVALPRSESSRSRGEGRAAPSSPRPSSRTSGSSATVPRSTAGSRSTARPRQN